MPRSVTTTFRNALEAERSDVFSLWFLEITHERLSPPVRVVNDQTAWKRGAPLDYTYDGKTYVAYPFALEWLTDSDDTPTARLTVQNVDRRIGTSIRSLTTPPFVDIKLLSSVEFRLPQGTETKMQPIGTPTIQARASLLRLVGVETGAERVSGELRSFDVSSEPAFGICRATPANAPGLWI